MKVEDLTQEEFSFRPIQFRITIESFEEAAELWLRLNAQFSAILQNNRETCATILGDPRAQVIKTGTAFDELWNMIDNRINRNQP